MLREDIGGVGGIGSSPKYPRPSYPIHLLLFKQSKSTDYVSHTAQRMSVCNHRDRRKHSRTFIVTPRGIFLPVILDRSLTFFSHPRSPNLMPPAPYLTSPPKSPHSPPPPLLSPVLGKQGGTLISVVKLAARDRMLNE